jgi:butyryl-CoA dehydrogenase
MLFVMNELAGLAAVNLPGCEDATPETAEAVLEENAKFVRRRGRPAEPRQRQRAELLAEASDHLKGFKEAFRLREAGWQGVQHPTEFGGQGLPKLVATPCIEMLNAANMSFALCPCCRTAPSKRC